MRKQIPIKQLFVSEAHAIPFHEEIPEGQCANCGAQLNGRFCISCGQKDKVRKDFSLNSFIGETVHQFTHFDSKFLSSFRTLLFHPGKLTVEYLRGKRKAYMQPVQLFIIINLLYFLYLHFIPVTTFTSYLKIQYNQLPYSKSTVRPLVNKKVTDLTNKAFSEAKTIKAKITKKEWLQVYETKFREYSLKFDSSIGGLAKTLIVLMIPLLAIVFGILYILRGFYVVEHLVFATHYFSFFLILVSVGVTLFLLPVMGVAEMFGVHLTEQDQDRFATFGPGIVAGIYLFIALRKVYRESQFVTFLKTSFVMLLMIRLINIYRLILFYITFYSVGSH